MRHRHIYITPAKSSGKSLFEVLPASHVDSPRRSVICSQFTSLL